MAKTKICGATITLDEAHESKTLDCDMEVLVNEKGDSLPHDGPLHYDNASRMGWFDPDLPVPEEE